MSSISTPARVQLADDLGEQLGAAGDRDGELARVLARRRSRPCRSARSTSRGGVDLVALVDDDLDPLAAGAGLELVGGAAGDDPAAVDHTMSWASWSASSRYWVVSSRVVPPATSSLMTSHSCCRLRGSRPVVGSSMNITGGETTRAAARSSRRRMPPEYVLAVRSAASARLNRSSSSPARRLRRPARSSGRAGRPSGGSRGRSGIRRPRRTGRRGRSSGAPRRGACSTSMPGDDGLAAVGPQQGGQHADGGGLARAVRARAGPRTVPSGTSRSTPSSALYVAEGLHQAFGIDGAWHMSSPVVRGDFCEASIYACCARTAPRQRWRTEHHNAMYRVCSDVLPEE